MISSHRIPPIARSCTFIGAIHLLLSIGEGEGVDEESNKI